MKYNSIYLNFLFSERNLQRQEKILRTDAVACAYIAAGRIDCLLKEENVPEDSKSSTTKIYKDTVQKEDDEDQQPKRKFLFNLKLKKVTSQQKQGLLLEETVPFEVCT